MENEWMPPGIMGSQRPHVACVSLTGGDNFVALDLIVQHVHSQLEKVSATI